jgi:hypothetical protein
MVRPIAFHCRPSSFVYALIVRRSSFVAPSTPPHLALGKGPFVPAQFVLLLD